MFVRNHFRMQIRGLPLCEAVRNSRTILWPRVANFKFQVTRTYQHKTVQPPGYHQGGNLQIYHAISLLEYLFAHLDRLRQLSSSTWCVFLRLASLISTPTPVNRFFSIWFSSVASVWAGPVLRLSPILKLLMSMSTQVNKPSWWWHYLIFDYTCESCDIGRSSLKKGRTPRTRK